MWRERLCGHYSLSPSFLLVGCGITHEEDDMSWFSRSVDVVKKKMGLAHNTKKEEAMRLESILNSFLTEINGLHGEKLMEIGTRVHVTDEIKNKIVDVCTMDGVRKYFAGRDRRTLRVEIFYNREP